MRSRLMLYCLVAVCAAAEQPADSQPSPSLLGMDTLSLLAQDPQYAGASSFSAQGHGRKPESYSNPGYNGRDGRSGPEGQYRSDGGRGDTRAGPRGSEYPAGGGSEGEYRSDGRGADPLAYGSSGGHGSGSARGYSAGLPRDAAYPYLLLGQHGLVFERRYSRASGLMNPITPDALAHLGYRQKKKDQVFVPPY